MGAPAAERERRRARTRTDGHDRPLDRSNARARTRTAENDARRKTQEANAFAGSRRVEETALILHAALRWRVVRAGKKKGAEGRGPIPSSKRAHRSFLNDTFREK